MASTARRPTRPLLPPPFLDAAARRVKCPLAAAQVVDIIEPTVKLSLDNP